MATFVRRVPLLVYVFVISTFKDCETQGVVANVNRNLNFNPNEIPNKLNPGVNVGNQNQPGLAGNLPQQPQQMPMQPQAQLNINPMHQQAGQNLQGAKKMQPPFAQGLANDQFGGVKQPGVGGNNMLKFEGKSVRTLMLADHPDCMDDVLRICSTTMKRNNFAVLDCLQDKAAEEKIQVSDQCQHVVWTYKRNLTLDDRFESAQNEVCAKELHEYQDCASLEPERGKRIPCLIEHMQNITGPCRHFLNRMAKIVFSDYHLIWHFMENCAKDIESFRCGRSETDQQEPQLHKQGATIECLGKHVRQLSKTCKKQILRTAELQSDDYHLDRPLYYACREDRETLCGHVEAGGGKVFECLFNHKSSRDMSDKCRELLTVRQQLMAEDVKVDETFYSACQHDIHQHQCLQENVDDQDWARSIILLCLENALKRDMKVSGECIAEMKELRTELMEDYQITPELVAGCGAEIQKYCQGLGAEGKTIHCLMKFVNPRTRKPTQEFTVECRAAIETLLQEADIEEDVKIDHVLAQACAPVIETACKPGMVQRQGMINCLIDKLDDERMTDDCEDRLLEIQYFVVRDFRLDPELYRMCHKDAIELCHASPDWANTMKPGVDNSPTVFPCLYRHMKNEGGPELSKACRREVKRTMRQRAKRVELDPKIEEACLVDLGEHCSDLEHYGKDQEIECLQDNYEELREDCQDAVGNFTEDEDEDIELDTILMRACTPMIKKFCQDILDRDPDANDVMDCLIEHKNNREMNMKCAAGIEHHQLTQLKDFKFSHKFKEACKKSVISLCPGKVKKDEIIVCLSEIVRADVLTENEHRVDDKCRKELKVEVLRRGEDIRLDPELKRACDDDIKKFCHGKHPGNAEIMECLKDNQQHLGNECHKVIFKREKVETMNSFGDYALLKACKPMIKIHCSMEMNNGPSDVMDCLKRVKNNVDFDATCRTYVMKRQLEESKDYRLNPSLMKRCRLDIPKFCKHLNLDQETELEGKIIHCLKQEYVKKRLSSDCTEEIRTIVRETAMNIDLDPVLMKACQKEMGQYCEAEIKEHESRPHANVGDAIEECLKRNLYQGNIKHTTLCGREILLLADETRIDVYVDVQLHMACQTDLNRFCYEVESGQGQKMSCLLSMLEEKPKELKSACLKLLTQRKTLWEFAADAAPPESIQELGSAIIQSRAKTYLIGVLMTIIGIIFLVGISCGRVTKRVPLSMKNK